MKILITTLIALGLCFSAFAADYSTLNDTSMAVLLKVVPRLRALSRDFAESKGLLAANVPAQLQTEALQGLLKPYGMTEEEFSQLMQKLAIGFTKIKAKEKDAPIKSYGFEQLEGPSIQEMGVIRRNLPKLEKILATQ